MIPLPAPSTQTSRAEGIFLQAIARAWRMLSHRSRRPSSAFLNSTNPRACRFTVVRHLQSLTPRSAEMTTTGIVILVIGVIIIAGLAFYLYRERRTKTLRQH